MANDNMKIALRAEADFKAAQAEIKATAGALGDLGRAGGDVKAAGVDQLAASSQKATAATQALKQESAAAAAAAKAQAAAASADAKARIAEAKAEAAAVRARAAAARAEAQAQVAAARARAAAAKTEAKAKAAAAAAAALAANGGVAVNSAKQNAQALRQLPMQMTDITVGLATGQSPLMVLMQQGGQLKDMFGGIAPAAKAVGGAVLGMVNPFTVAAAAAAALALAYKQGSDEADGYVKALAMTGNAAGVSAGQISAMARRVGETVGTTGAAAEALTALAASGHVGGASLEKLGASAIRFERATGQAVSTTVEQFAALGKEPVKASLKLNEQLGYLTLAQREQIQSLMDQGRASEAAALAQSTYATAMNGVSQQVKDNAGTMQRAWESVAGAAKGAWDAMLDIGRTDD
ncbi:MAG: phage tail length tape measure family protein, partial [Burkholderiaceae bacterium]